MTKIFKTTLITFILIVIAYGGWKYYSSIQEEPTVNTNIKTNTETVSGGVKTSSSEDEKIFEILAVLKSIEIDVEFFKNKTLNSLTDFSKELSPEPVISIFK